MSFKVSLVSLLICATLYDMINTLIVCSIVLTPLDVISTDSSVSGEFNQSIFMPGTLIGNYDAKTNPEGTSTLPGVWGGSGNNFIDCELTPSFGGPYNSDCVGGLEVEIDVANNLMIIDGLQLSSFNEGPASFPVTLGMLYETFRSVQPDSLFPGGVQVDIPIGEGTVDVLDFEQTVEVSTELSSSEMQSWSYEVEIPVNITLELTVLETSSGPLVTPGFLFLSGTVEQSGSQIQLDGSASWKSNDTVEDPPLAFENIPFDAPTIIPSGQIAHLLLSAVAESATTTNVATIHFVAQGEVQADGDVDGDGIVGVNDLLAIISAWGACKNCPEDLNGDSFVNVTDLLEVIANWSGS